MLSARVQLDLYRWAFTQAQVHLGDEIFLQPTDEEVELVDALANMFGDTYSYVLDIEGDMSVVIKAAVRSVLSLIDDLADGSIERELEGG